MINKENLKLDIGLRVKEIRVNKMHMTKVQFANLIGMKNQYLGTVENGQRGLTIEKVLEICEKTGVSCDYLLRGKDDFAIPYALKKYSKKEICKSFEILQELSLIL